MGLLGAAATSTSLSGDGRGLVVGPPLALTLLGRTLLWNRHGDLFPLIEREFSEGLPAGVLLFIRASTGTFGQICST